MSLKCPNKNSQEWKDLVNIQGTSYASFLWNEFESIPEVYTKEKYNPVNPQHLSNTVIKELEDKLISTLKDDFNMSVEEYSSIKEELGIDAKSATDLLSKVVVYEKGESIIPEVAYIAYKLLGRENNKLKSDLRYLVNKWDNYSERFNYHKGVVFKEEGFVEDIKEWRNKVIDLVIQDFLAAKMYEHHTNPIEFKKSTDVKWTSDDFTLWNKIVKMFENFLNGIKGVDKAYKLNRIGLSIADDILSRNYQYYNYNLEKGQVQKSYEETIASDPKAKEIVDFGRLELNLNLTGSLALRRNGTVYRTTEETVHDIDWTVPYERSTTTNDDVDTINRIKGLQSLGLDRIELRDKTLAEIEKLSWFKDFKSKYPTYEFKTGFYGNETNKFTTIGVIDGESYTEDGYHEESYSYLKKNLITKKTKKVTKKRTVKHKKGDYIQDTGYMIDFFIRLEPNNDIQEDYFKDWKSIMAAKLEMSRSKDLTDWKAFVPFKIDKDSNFTYKGFRHINYKDSNSTNLLEDTENSENKESTFQKEEAFNWVSTIMENADNDLVQTLLKDINDGNYNSIDDLISLAEELEEGKDSYETNKLAWNNLNPLKQEEILEEASKEFNIKRKSTKDLPLYNITNKNIEVTLNIINNLKVAKQLSIDGKSVETIKQVTGWSNINSNWTYDANHIGINKSRLSYYKNSGTKEVVSIKNILDDTLFKIFPQLDKIKVVFNNTIPSSEYNNDTKVISLNPNNYVNTLTNLLTLEVRKAIQSIEGDLPTNIKYNKENNIDVNNILSLIDGIDNSQKEILLQSLDLSEYTGDLALIDKVLNSFSLNDTINSWLKRVKDFFNKLYIHSKDLLKTVSTLIKRALPKSNISDIKEPTINNLINSLSNRFGIKTRIISNEEIGNFVDLKDNLLYSKLTKENIGNAYEDFLKSNFSFKEDQQYEFVNEIYEELFDNLNKVFKENSFKNNIKADKTKLEKYSDYGYFDKINDIDYTAPYVNLQTLETNPIDVKTLKNDLVDISIEIENTQKEINRLETLFNTSDSNSKLEIAANLASLILTKNKLIGFKISMVGTLWFNVNRVQNTQYKNHNLKLMVNSVDLDNQYPDFIFNLVDTSNNTIIGELDITEIDGIVSINSSKIADIYTKNSESYGKSFYRAVSWGVKTTFNEHIISHKHFKPVEVNGETKLHAKEAWNRWVTQGIAIDKGSMFQLLYSKYGDNINGFYDSKTKEAYLVDTKADVSTTIHEAFSHPFIQVIKDSNPKLYQSLLEEASKIKEIKEAIDANYSELDQETKEQEIIAHAIDMYVNNELDEIRDKTLIARIKEFFKELSKSLKAILNVKNLEAKDIPLLTLQEVAQYALYGKGTMDLTKATSSDAKTLLQLNISSDKLNDNKKKALEAKLAAFKAKKEAQEQEVLTKLDRVVLENDNGLIIIKNAIDMQTSINIINDSKDLIEETSFKQTQGSVSWGWGLQWIRINGMSSKQKEGLIVGKQLNGITITPKMKADFIADKKVNGMPLYGYTEFDYNGNKLPNIPTNIINLMAEQGIDISEYDASYNSVYDKKDNGKLIIHQDNTEQNTSPIITMSFGRPMKFITYELNDKTDFNVSDPSNTAFRIALNAVNGEAQKLGLIPNSEYVKDYDTKAIKKDRSGLNEVTYGHFTPNTLLNYAKQIDEKNGTSLLTFVEEKLKEQFKNATKTERVLENGAVLVFSNENRNVLHEIVFDEEINSKSMPEGFPTLRINKAFKGLNQNDNFINTDDYRVVLTLRKVQGEVVDNIDTNKLLSNTKERGLATYTNHSGGALGSDTEWDTIGKKYGMVNSKHYFTGVKSNQNAPLGNVDITDKPIAKEGAKKVAKAAKEMWGYKFASMTDTRLIRNWAQVAYSDAVFAIGTFGNKGDIWKGDETKAKDKQRILLKTAVQGGTGYAVEMAIQAGKPVYFFDQIRNQWYSNINNVWSKTEVPKLTKNFAGIGTREINENGRKAIEDVYLNSLPKNDKNELNNNNQLDNTLTNIIVNPIDITSKSNSQLGKDLTNVHYANNGKSQFDIVPTDKTLNNPSLGQGLNGNTAQDTWGNSVEAWYKTNNAKANGITEGSQADAFDFKLMIGLIQDKLTQYPNLVTSINKQGGLEFINQSTHNMGTGRWSSKGKNMFIKALAEAYTKVNSITTTNINKPFYTGDIVPSQDTVFVFGSNPIGVNGNPTLGTGGAALVASTQFGVKQGEKMDNKLSDSGNAYGLTTVTSPGNKLSVSSSQITANVVKMYEVARQNPNKIFKVAYRNTDTKSLNGYTGNQMINMFVKAGTVPSNVQFSEEWIDTKKLDKVISSLRPENIERNARKEASTAKHNVTSIYSKLGKTTKTILVEIKSVFQKAGIEYAKSNNAIFSLRVNDSKTHFGNAYLSPTSDVVTNYLKDNSIEDTNENRFKVIRKMNLIPATSTRDSVEKYLNWILNGATLTTKNIFKINTTDVELNTLLSISSRFIGHSDVNGSDILVTGLDNKSLTNVKEYSSNDVVTVEMTEDSLEPSELKSFQDKTIKETVKALNQGAVVITKVSEIETRLSSNLSSFGFENRQETINGVLINVWYNKATDPYRAGWIRQQLKSQKLKGKKIIYYQELNQPSHATALAWLINSKDSPFVKSENKENIPDIEKTQPKSKSILIGGFNDVIKSVEEGNDADIAMRKAATGGSIVEMSFENVSKPNTTLTTLMDNDTLENTETLRIIIKDVEGTNYTIDQRESINDKNYPVSVKRHNGTNSSMFGTRQGEVVALSRDEGLRGKPLMPETKKSILEAHNNGVTFIVRDRNNIDNYFIMYLDAIGASYSLYHTGKSPNIQPSKVVTEFDKDESEGFKFKDNKIKDIKQINIADENTSLLGLKTRLDNLGEKLKINEFVIKRIYNDLKANFSRRFKLDSMSDSVSKIDFVRSEEYLLQGLEDLNSLGDNIVPSNYKQLAKQLITSQISKINSDSILDNNSNVIDFSKSKNTLTKNEESIIGLMYKFKVLKYNYDINKTLDIDYQGNSTLENEIRSIYTVQLEEYQIDKYKKALSPKIGLPNLIAKTKGNYKVEIEKARLIAGDNDSQGEKINKWIESLIQSAVDNAKYLALGALNLTLDNADIQSAITFLGLSKEGIISLLTNKEFSIFFNGFAKNNDIMNMKTTSFTNYLDQYAETNELVDLAPSKDSNQTQVEYSIAYLNSVHRSKDLRLSSFDKNYVYHMMTVLVKYSNDYGNINNELKSQYPIKGRPSQQEGQFEQILKGLGLEGYSPADVERLLNELDEHLETGNSIFSSDYFVNRMQSDSILPKGMVALAFPHSREMLRSHIQFHKIKQASHLLHTPKIKKFRDTLANMMDSEVFNKSNGKDKIWSALYNAIGNIFLYESYFSSTTKGNDVLRNVLNKSDGLFNPINITSLSTGGGINVDKSIEFALYKAKDSEEFLSHAAEVVKTIKTFEINKEEFAFIHSLSTEGDTIKFRASETMLDKPQEVAKFKAQFNRLPKELRDMLFKYLLVHKSYGLTYSTDSWFGFMDYNVFKNYNKFLNIAELAPGTLFKNDYLYRELIYFSLQNTEYISQFQPYSDNTLLNGENYYKILNNLPDTIPSYTKKGEAIPFKKPIMIKAKRGFKSNIGQSISKKDFVNKNDVDTYTNNETVSYDEILIASLEKDTSLAEKLRLAKAELVKKLTKEELDELGVSSKNGEKYKWVISKLRRDNTDITNFTDVKKQSHSDLQSKVDSVLDNDTLKKLKDKETAASFVYVNKLSKIKEEITAEVKKTNEILAKAGDIVIDVDTTIDTVEGPVIIKESLPYNELTSKFATTKSLIKEEKQELQLILDNLLDEKKSELIYENEINKRFIKGISNIQDDVLDYIPESIELPDGQPLLKTLIKRESTNGEQEEPTIAVYMATPKVLPHITEAEGYIPQEGDNDLVYRRIYNYNENSLANPHFVTMDIFDKRLNGILYNSKSKTEFLGENWKVSKNKQQESFEEWVQYGASIMEDNMYYDQPKQEKEQTKETVCAQVIK